MKTFFNSKLLILFSSLLLSLIFTFFLISKLDFFYKPYTIHSLKLNILAAPTPLNGHPTKSSNPLFYEYINSKLRFPAVSFDSLYFENKNLQNNCSDFLNTEYIKNPFLSSRIVLVFENNSNSVTIQARHKQPDIAYNCAKEVSSILNTMLLDNISFAKTSLKNFMKISEQKRSILYRSPINKNLEEIDINYVLKLNTSDFEALFSNKNEFNKFWAGLKPNQVRKYYDDVKSFNLLFDEANQYLVWINKIKTSSTKLSIKSVNNSIYRVIQIFLSALFSFYILLTLISKLFIRLSKLN